MPILGYIVIFTLLGSVVSLIGGVLLLIKRSFALKISHFLSAFAAGTMLGAAFLDLLPESLEHAEELGLDVNIPLWVLLGVLSFFLLERFIHHHHQSEVKEKALISMIAVGDTMHNFVDGVAIAATFLISPPLGMVTTLAVAAHEIPQEMGDFGLMLGKGISRGKVMLINFTSSMAAMAGALITYLNQDALTNHLPIILALTSGFFIYIAASNLIPEIHSKEDKKVAFLETVMLFIGVLVVYVAVSTLEGPH
jgi:zinc and cadmium transporter